MSSPKPSFRFTIPSVYDGTPLDCRIYRPFSIDQNGEGKKWRTQGAIVAHPYAPLGGCYDDPVVKTVTEELMALGYMVLTFNFRGAGGSKGRTSWTAKPEMGDYISVTGFMLHYLTMLTRSSHAAKIFLPTMNLELILGGYSYGSMIVSGLPNIDQIKSLFESHPAEAAISSIASKAKDVSRMQIELAILQASSDRHMETETQEIHPTEHSLHAPMTLANPCVSYLLISPILPPVSMFVSMSWLTGTTTDITIFGQKLSAGNTEKQLSSHSTLVIYANDDGFTSSRKIRPWVQKLKDIPQSKFTSCEVVGAGHFWIKPETQRQMRDAIRQWINPSSTDRFAFR